MLRSPLSITTSSLPPPAMSVPPLMLVPVLAAGVTRMPPVLTTLVPVRARALLPLKRSVLTVKLDGESLPTSTLLPLV